MVNNCQKWPKLSKFAKYRQKWSNMAKKIFKIVKHDDKW